MSSSESTRAAQAADLPPPHEDVVGRLRRGELSSSALTELYLSRIERFDPAVGAFLTVMDEAARDQARNADAALARGETPLPLHGLPVALKDNIDVANVVTTVGSRFFAESVATRDSEVARRLREAGAVILGKVSLHEFAYGGTTQNPHHRICRNPWDLDRIPGGSSGGSGAALAADLCAAALGTDTGGSVRGPAALNGVSALRPTQGLISNRGVFPITWSFDTVGPMARSVGDIAAVLAVLAGFDVEDVGSVERPHETGDPGEQPGGDLTGIRIGLPTSFYFDEVQPEVAAAVRGAAELLASLGAQVDDIDIPGAEQADEVTRRLIWAEALAIHQRRLAEQPELFGEDTRRRLPSGESVSGVDYGRYLQQAREWRRTLRGVFQSVDLVLSPAAAAVAPRADDSETIATTEKLTRLTYGWSLGGLPALAVPCGFSAERLPIGLQLAARPWNESLLLRVGAAYQRATDWHRRAPTLTAP